MQNVQIVVDSGSTKSDWLVFKNNVFIEKINTLGMNPEVVSSPELIKRLKVIKEQIISYLPAKLDFFGAGCSTTRSVSILKNQIRNVFSNDELLINQIKEDTYAAVYATCKLGEPGIVCINGTGSNCSFYDGKNIYQYIDSLGYLAMDDFSGVSFGRQLIRAYYFKQLPEELRMKFDQVYDMNPDTIKENFYAKENPNAYLASFLPFLIEHKKHPFFQKLITQEFDFFVENYIKQFPNQLDNAIHFIGSTAFLLQEEVIRILTEKQLKIGRFYQKPMDGLIEFYTIYN